MHLFVLMGMVMCCQRDWQEGGDELLMAGRSPETPDPRHREQLHVHKGHRFTVAQLNSTKLGRLSRHVKRLCVCGSASGSVCSRLVSTDTAHWFDLTTVCWYQVFLLKCGDEVDSVWDLLNSSLLLSYIQNRTVIPPTSKRNEKQTCFLSWIKKQLRYWSHNMFIYFAITLQIKNIQSPSLFWPLSLPVEIRMKQWSKDI